MIANWPALILGTLALVFFIAWARVRLKNEEWSRLMAEYERTYAANELNAFNRGKDAGRIMERNDMRTKQTGELIHTLYGSAAQMEEEVDRIVKLYDPRILPANTFRLTRLKEPDMKFNVDINQQATKGGFVNVDVNVTVDGKKVHSVTRTLDLKTGAARAQLIEDGWTPPPENMRQVFFFSDSDFRAVPTLDSWKVAAGAGGGSGGAGSPGRKFRPNDVVFSRKVGGCFKILDVVKGENGLLHYTYTPVDGGDHHVARVSLIDADFMKVGTATA